MYWGAIQGLGFPKVVGTFERFMGVRYGLRVSQNWGYLQIVFIGFV